MNELSSDDEEVGCCCDFFAGDFNESSGKNVIGILLDDGKLRFCGNVCKGVFFLFLLLLVLYVDKNLCIVELNWDQGYEWNEW